MEGEDPTASQEDRDIPERDPTASQKDGDISGRDAGRDPTTSQEGRKLLQLLPGQPSVCQPVVWDLFQGL